MTKDQLNQLIELNDEFQKDCERVKLQMQRCDSDYFDVESEWSIDNGRAHAEGDVWSRGCFMGTTHVWFDLNLLTYTDDELKDHVDNIISEKKAKEAKELEEKKKKENETKLRMYNKLKEELGL